MVWCYAILQKNVVYIKSILDLIHSYSSKCNENPNNALIKVKELKNEYGSIQEEMNQEYGSTARLETDNPFDIVDSFSVLVNRPEIGTYRALVHSLALDFPVWPSRGIKL